MDSLPTVTPSQQIPAGNLTPWDVGDLPPTPQGGWRSWLRLIGPGVLLAGVSIGSGEWLAGPGISAQYGGTLLWVATLSIVGQVFCNIEFMRYALYCGEPITVGFFRTPPGPRVWLLVYLVLDFGAIWPYNASNAAVPLAAALLGHLPGEASVSLGGLVLSESELVKLLGCAIFLVAFLPLVFGGTIYRMLELLFTFKLIVVLVYLVGVAVFMVSGPTAWEVATGFFRLGAVPLRADTVIADRHFTLTEYDGTTSYRIKGTVERAGPLVTEFTVGREDGETTYKSSASVPPPLKDRLVQLRDKAVARVEPGRFYVADRVEGRAVAAEGHIARDRTWRVDGSWLADELGNQNLKPTPIAELPEPVAHHLGQLVDNQGLRRVGLVSHVVQHRRLPALDWGLIAVFASIAGTGGMTNTLFSNFVREKGWGMGAHVGAIPSAIGGKIIALSHVGMAFSLSSTNRARWRGWMRHILRDQLAVWMLCSIIGMALPCMMSLEFIRNAPVSGDRVAAMTADGMAERYPEFRDLAWFVTLAIGFLVLAPGQVMAGDSLSRRWTDIAWVGNPLARKLDGTQVKYVYYAILATYGVWGLVTMILFDPLQVLKIAGVIGNIALGATAWHALYVNRLLLPRELRPGWLMWLGTFACGVFFMGISAIVIIGLLTGS